MGIGTGKNSTGSGAEYDGSYQTVQNMQIGFAPGMTAFITDWSAVGVSVGVMGFDFKWIDQETNKVEEGRQRVSSGNFKINLFSINIGMTFYLLRNEDEESKYNLLYNMSVIIDRLRD